MTSVRTPRPLRRQRLQGFLLVVAVTAAALVAAQVSHAPVAGYPAREPIPGPPAVGDCLLDPTSTQQHSQGDGLVYPWLRTGPCRGRRFGEVAGVLTKQDLLQPPASTSPNNDPYSAPCRAAVAGWLRMPTPGGVPVFGRWAPDLLAVATVLSGPSQLQRRSGQDWLACIAAAGGGGPGGTATAGYGATARDTFGGPGLPLPVFAYCMPTVNNFAMVHCSSPHSAERFGSTLSDHGPTETDRLDCQALVQRLTGMTDPTASGLLTAVAVESGNRTADHHFLECLTVTVSPHYLIGPLLGLASRPVPIS